MNLTKRILATLLIVLTMLMVDMTAFAQDAVVTDEPAAAATQEATPGETAEATPAATQDVIVIVTQTPAESPTPTLTPTPEMTATAVAGTGGNGGSTGGSSDSNGSSVIVIVISLLTLVLGGGTLMSIVAGFRKDTAGTAATEQLGNSVPKEVALELVKLLKGVVSGAEIAIEALDQIPAASKPGVLAQFSVAELRAEIERQEAARG